MILARPNPRCLACLDTGMANNREATIDACGRCAKLSEMAWIAHGKNQRRSTTSAFSLDSDLPPLDRARARTESPPL